ncbi:MAG: dihydropyrimidinase, partial [Candidatus Acidiferrales bacterium]
MRFDLIIQNGIVVTAADTCAADVGIVGDTIAAIGKSLPTDGAQRVVNAQGRLVLPGGIDVH